LKPTLPKSYARAMKSAVAESFTAAEDL